MAYALDEWYGLDLGHQGIRGRPRDIILQEDDNLDFLMREPQYFPEIGRRKEEDPQYQEGAGHDDDNGPESGSAYVFKRSGTTWTEEDKLTASDGAILDWFGRSVSIDGDYVLIGAYLDDDNGPSSGSAYVFKKATPDLVCEGTLSWTNIQPGKEVTGSIWVANGGEVGTKLSWKIESYPTWGVWTFVPSSGNGLTPAMGSITITVEVVAPNGANTVFSGDVKIVNTNDPTDSCRIPVSLSTPKNKAITINTPFLQFVENFFERYPNMFPILRQLSVF